VSYASFGIPLVINAAGAQSRLGGSILSAGVRTAMSEAGQNFVHVPEFHDYVGKEIAKLTMNGAACVSCGAAAGILVAVAACLVGADSSAAALLPDRISLSKRDVVIWRNHLGGSLAGADGEHENGYLSAVAMAGGNLRPIDSVDELQDTDVCLLWFPSVFANPIEQETFTAFILRAKELQVPIIVDAADQIPPVSNLWHYTKSLGADLAIFSGGKGLRGPSSSGLILGRSDLVAACRANSGIEHSVGRPAKVGKEELAGILAAVQEAVAEDFNTSHARWCDIIATWIEALSPLAVKGFTFTKTEHSHSGQPVPRLLISVPENDRTLRDRIIDQLWSRSPRIAVLPELNGTIALNPQAVRDHEVSEITRALEEEMESNIGKS
jgi:seryl-tRNA(Sec) selenium transferase